MNNEEAKALYLEGLRFFEAKAYADALAAFERLDEARPNSRHVTMHRGLCCLALGSLEEAGRCVKRLRGKIDDARWNVLRDAVISAKVAGQREAALRTAIAAARGENGASRARVSEDAPSLYGGEAVVVIEAVYPVDAETCSAMARVEAGVLPADATLSVMAPDGAASLAPVRRIGPADAPLKLLRRGERAGLVLGVGSDRVRAGAATLVVGGVFAGAPREINNRQEEPITIDEDAEIASDNFSGEPKDVVPMMRAGDYARALSCLRTCLDRNAADAAAQHLLARVYLEAPPPIADPPRALAHARRAYELTEGEGPEVLETLAEALAANGEAEHGLRFLTRLSGQLGDGAARSALRTRMREYRRQHGLGVLWECADPDGRIIEETANLETLARGLQRGAIPRDAVCRREGSDTWRPVAQVIRREAPAVAAAHGVGGGVGDWWFYVAVAMLVALLVGTVVYAN